MLLAFIRHATYTFIKPHQSVLHLCLVGRVNFSQEKLLSNPRNILYKLLRSYSNMLPILKRQEIVCQENTSASAADPNFYKLSFKLTSYNILAQYYLDTNFYLYDHCEPEFLKWPFRWNNLLKEISSIDSDIYCFQEVQKDHYEKDILPSMQNLGFKGLYQRKSDKKPDGCALFYRESMFQLITYKGFTYFRPEIPSLSFYNCGQVALLRPKTAPELHTNGGICIGNTHLFFNPNRGDVKAAQLCLFLAEVDLLARQSSDEHYPTIICGDLNVEPFSPLYEFILNGRLDFPSNPIWFLSGQNETSFPSNARNSDYLSGQSFTEKMACLQISRHCVYFEKNLEQESTDDCVDSKDYLAHRFDFIDCLEYYKSSPNKRLVTSFTSEGTCAVDHIFYAQGSGHLNVTKYLSLTEPDALNNIKGIPNSEISSDHIPLVAHFLYKEPLK